MPLEYDARMEEHASTHRSDTIVGVHPVMQAHIARPISMNVLHIHVFTGVFARIWSMVMHVHVDVASLGLIVTDLSTNVLRTHA